MTARTACPAGRSAGGLLQKVSEHGVAVLGQHAFGVELHAFDGQGFVAHGHDFAVIVAGGGDFQLRRAGGALNHQRVVAIDGELPGQPGEHAFLIGGDDAGFAVHLPPGAHDAPDYEIGRASCRERV